MSADIYTRHSSAFQHVGAYVILDAAGERVATVAIKYGARLWAYFHLIGVEMVRSHADGGGYDKESAAVAGALAKVKPYTFNGQDREYGETINAHRGTMQEAVPAMDSTNWRTALERAGYRVIQAV